MNIVILYVTTAVIFLGLDAMGLRFLIRPVFELDIGGMLRESPRLVPAAIFYLFYVGGLLWFVSLPALRSDGPLLNVFLLGALFGALAYGTYEFTNIATLEGWTWRMLATDLIWGTLLTGIAAGAGLAVTRAVT
ncbi:MAG: DUF2177 family protein [Pseudohongiella sp.]|nr:DUF2177 family protein [Pseudohongiella sp.]MDP2128145.1 DUF2177 family protein [Pseudohongiella sp.]